MSLKHNSICVPRHPRFCLPYHHLLSRVLDPSKRCRLCRIRFCALRVALLAHTSGSMTHLDFRGQGVDGHSLPEPAQCLTTTITLDCLGMHEWRWTLMA